MSKVVGRALWQWAPSELCCFLILLYFVTNFVCSFSCGEPGTLMRNHSEWCLTVYGMFVLCICWIKCFSAFLDYLAKLVCFSLPCQVRGTTWISWLSSFFFPSTADIGGHGSSKTMSLVLQSWVVPGSLSEPLSLQFYRQQSCLQTPSRFFLFGPFVLLLSS